MFSSRLSRAYLPHSVPTRVLAPFAPSRSSSPLPSLTALVHPFAASQLRTRTNANMNGNRLCSSLFAFAFVFVALALASPSPSTTPPTRALRTHSRHPTHPCPPHPFAPYHLGTAPFALAPSPLDRPLGVTSPPLAPSHLFAPSSHVRPLPHHPRLALACKCGQERVPCSCSHLYVSMRSETTALIITSFTSLGGPSKLLLPPLLRLQLPLL